MAITHELIIKKSRFICYIYNLDNIDEIDSILSNLKKEHKRADHFCYAYIIGNKEKAFNDKEPNGTAGLPILNVLKKNNLNNIFAIVIRYYGGIKLGAGGLIRAYSKAVSEAIKKA